MRTCTQCGQIVRRYQPPICPHKEEYRRYAGPLDTIWAARISGIEKDGPMRAFPSGALLVDNTYTLWLSVANAMPLSDKQAGSVDAEWLQEHRPEVGGYYCVDAEDNESYVPAAAFHAYFRAQ